MAAYEMTRLLLTYLHKSLRKGLPRCAKEDQGVGPNPTRKFQETLSICFPKWHIDNIVFIIARKSWDLLYHHHAHYEISHFHLVSYFEKGSGEFYSIRTKPEENHHSLTLYIIEHFLLTHKDLQLDYPVWDLVTNLKPHLGMFLASFPVGNF